MEHTKGVVTSDRRGTAKGGLLRDETHDLGSDGERDAAYRQRLAGLAWHEETNDPAGRPDNPDCNWYGPFGEGREAWWEYWYFWPHWGWEFVFWVWA